MANGPQRSVFRFRRSKSYRLLEPWPYRNSLTCNTGFSGCSACVVCVLSYQTCSKMGSAL